MCVSDSFDIQQPTNVRVCVCVYRTAIHSHNFRYLWWCTCTCDVSKQSKAKQKKKWWKTTIDIYIHTNGVHKYIDSEYIRAVMRNRKIQPNTQTLTLARSDVCLKYNGVCVYCMNLYACSIKSNTVSAFR